MIKILLKRIGLPRARVFNRELYVIGSLVTGATGEEIPFHTHPVRKVKRGRPTIFDPPVVLFEGDPAGFVVGELIVMESDEDFRLLGERVSKIRDLLNGSSLLAGVLLAGAPQFAKVRKAMRPAMDEVERALEESSDDVMSRFSIDLGADDDYRLGETVTLASMRAEVDIEIVRVDQESDWRPVGGARS